MSALTAAALKQRLRDEDPRSRLFVGPLLDPERQIKGSQAAIDVRLGRSFTLVKAWLQGVAEQLNGDALQTSEPPSEGVVLEYGEPLIIHPHQFVLGRTLEYVRVPRDLLAYVIGRSSWARRGLIVATAVIVHPGFAGPITLELKNVGEVPLALYPLDVVAQLAFHNVEPEAEADGSSQFGGTFTPTLGVVRDESTAAAIERMAQRRRPRRTGE